MANPTSVYTAKKAALLTNPTADTVVLQSENSAYAAFASLYHGAAASGTTGTSLLDGKTLYVRASGKITGGTTTNFTPKLWFSANAKTQITTTGATSIAAGTARAFNSTSGVFMIEATLVWDVTSQRLSGYFDCLNGSAGTLDAPAATTQVTGVDLALLTTPSGSPQSGPGIVVTGIFSATNAGNLFQLTELIAEVL
jgi:hypothetical protein